MCNNTKVLLDTLLAATFFTNSLGEQTVKHETRARRSLAASPVFTSVFHKANCAKSLVQKFFESSRYNDAFVLKNGNANTGLLYAPQRNKKILKLKETYWVPPQSIPTVVPVNKLPKSENPFLLSVYGIPKNYVPKPTAVYGIPIRKLNKYSIPVVSTPHESLPKIRISTSFRDFVPSNFSASDHKVSYHVSDYSLPKQTTKFLSGYSLPKADSSMFFLKHTSDPKQPHRDPKSKENIWSVLALRQPKALPNLLEIKPRETYELPKNSIPYSFMTNSSPPPLPTHYVEIPLIKTQPITTVLLRNKVPANFEEYRPRGIYGLPKKYIDLGLLQLDSEVSVPISLITNTHLDRKHETYGVPKLEAPPHRQSKRSVINEPNSDSVVKTQHFYLASTDTNVYGYDEAWANEIEDASYQVEPEESLDKYDFPTAPPQLMKQSEFFAMKNPRLEIGKSSGKDDFDKSGDQEATTENTDWSVGLVLGNLGRVISQPSITDTVDTPISDSVQMSNIDGQNTSLVNPLWAPYTNWLIGFPLGNLVTSTTSHPDREPSTTDTAESSIDGLVDQAIKYVEESSVR